MVKLIKNSCIILLLTLFYPKISSLSAKSCPIVETSLSNKIQHVANRIIIYSQFDPLAKIHLYFKKIHTPSNTYNQLIQHTHYLTLSVAELHKLRQVPSSIIDMYINTFLQHRTYLIEFINKSTECTNEVNTLLNITDSNQRVFEELLLDRLPEYHIPIDYIE